LQASDSRWGEFFGWLDIAAVFVAALGWPLESQVICSHLQASCAALWRPHRVHHGDKDLDVTPAMRFHSFEMILNASWLALSIVLLGVPRTGTALLAFIAVPLSLLQHANLRFPRSVDRWMRWALVSPVLHTGTPRGATVRLKEKPSYYFRRQCFISADPDERTIAALMPHVGEDKFFWASDYPHPDHPGTYVEELHGMVAPMTESGRRAILGKNVARAYGLA
jgi:Amidohydrolase/Fatty acid hydroxylase